MVLEKNPRTRPFAKKLLQLEDKYFGRPFPEMVRVKEISNYSCGPATLTMLLSFAGIKKTQTSLIRSIRAAGKIKLYGISVKEMGRAAKIAGKGKIVFWQKQFATVSDLDLAVNKYKFPVGVEWQGDFYENEDEDRGHYSVITKIDKKGGVLRTADPYFNTFFKYIDLDRKYGIKEFYKKWWDYNEIAVSGTSKRRKIKDTRMMFVVTKKGEVWPKKLGMKKV